MEGENPKENRPHEDETLPKVPPPAPEVPSVAPGRPAASSVVSKADSLQPVAQIPSVAPERPAASSVVSKANSLQPVAQIPSVAPERPAASSVVSKANSLQPVAQIPSLAPERPAASSVVSKAHSLQPVAQIPSEAPPYSTAGGNPLLIPSIVLETPGQVSNQISQNLAGEIPAPTLLSSIRAPSKSANDLESNQTAAKKTQNCLAAEGGGGVVGIPALGNFTFGFLNKRSPYIHNPPQPEERRSRIENPRTPREYIINLREYLADFQESHGLPRTRDYSFLSLGLALAQETARAFCSLFLMFAELFPIVAIVSLIMRFALDKLIEILETDETVPKVKKSIVFGLQMLVIIIPLWILIGTIIIPLLSLVFSIFKRMIRIKGRG